MIIQFFLDLPYYAISAFINLLPVSQGLPEEVLDATALIGSTIGIFGPVMPITTLSAALGILFAAQIGIWSFKALRWIVSHIPFIGGRA